MHFNPVFPSLSWKYGWTYEHVSSPVQALTWGWSSLLSPKLQGVCKVLSYIALDIMTVGIFEKLRAAFITGGLGSLVQDF